MATTGHSVFWLLTIPATTCFLGTWQLYRLQWKQGLLRRIDETLAQEPIELDVGAPVEADQVPTAAALYATRRVKLAGVFDHSREMLVGPRTHEGSSGVEVVTPLTLSNEDAVVVLVNRGFVPLAKKTQQSRPETLTTGHVEIVGLRRLFGGKPNSFVPDNQLKNNVWYYINPEEMAKAAGQGVLPIVVDATTTATAADGSAGKAKQMPIGREARIALRNDHLQYALTWYALTLGTLGMILYRRRIMKP